MLTVEFVNNGRGPDEAACYDVRVLVNGRVVALDQVVGHNRADDWKTLLRRLAGPPLKKER